MGKLKRETEPTGRSRPPAPSWRGEGRERRREGNFSFFSSAFAFACCVKKQKPLLQQPI